ncbi:hypothetical protein CSA37_08590 [Candidatus Fermentibacteria bacterium]|nr:MAG: hypothetical protein CSA37_08590 [Candidatus Fermentibacteria bacterium]
MLLKQLNCRGFFVDAVFRSEKKYSNHGTDVQKVVTCAVRQIRQIPGDEIPCQTDTVWKDNQVKIMLCDELERYLTGFRG